MDRNTHLTSTAIAQILHALRHHTKEIMDLIGATPTECGQWLVYPSSLIQRFTVLTDTSLNTVVIVFSSCCDTSFFLFVLF